MQRFKLVIIVLVPIFLSVIVIAQIGNSTSPISGSSSVPTALTPNSVCLDATNKDACLQRDAANILAQRNGTNGQVLRVYNTYTDASNGEWMALTWTDVGNMAILETGKNGSGQGRELGLIGNQIRFYVNNGAFSPWQMNTSGTIAGTPDNTYDIGASGATRPRNLFIGTSVTTPQLLGSGSVPTIAGCGTGASITGGNMFGKVTLGTTPGTCVVTFNATPTFTNAPGCFLNNQTSNLRASEAISISTTSFTIAPDVGVLTASDVIDYLCVSQ